MRYISNILTGVALCSLLFAATACDEGFIFENEGDCSPKVQFVFKKHRQALHSLDGREADVFYATVGSVHLFAYDAQTGELVFEKTEKTENLQSPAELGLGESTDRCMMSLDLNPGTYRFVAWCGLDENDSNNAFHLTDGSRGAYNRCNVKYSDVTGQPVNHEKYDGLYHGTVRSIEVRLDANSPQIIPVELTKNTNEIAVWVQHATKTFEEGEYEVVYTDSNGSMHFEDNTMQSTDRLEYIPHTTSLLTSDTEYNGSVVETGALVAHISTARLMEHNQNDARLEVRNKEGKAVFSIPFIKYVLQMQTLTNDSQRYLDCEDTYNCSFYLTGESGTWTPARIIINNWVVVPSQNDNL